MMTPAQAREINTLAFSLHRLCRIYCAPDGITVAANDLSRMTNNAVDGLASVQAAKEQAA